MAQIPLRQRKVASSNPAGYKNFGQRARNFNREQRNFKEKKAEMALFLDKNSGKIADFVEEST